jgi:hypothetical protein
MDVGVLMRAASLLVVAACTADVAPGTYFCGPDGACPEGQACNGPDNLCVVAAQAAPFDCTQDFADPAGDDTAASGHVLAMECVSGLNVTKGCLPAADAGDWYQFDVPAVCAAVQIDARLTFPVAFERLALQLSTANGDPAPVETACRFTLPANAPDEARCFTMAVSPGTHYAIGVVADGTGDCGGRCRNNRYTFSVQLNAP